MPTPIETEGPENPIIARAVDHYGAGFARMLEVPEWGPGEGVPLRVYVLPITVEQKSRLMQEQRDIGLLAASVNLIIAKAIDGEGKKLFTIADKIHLLRSVSPTVVEGLSARILATQYGSAAELEKK